MARVNLIQGTSEWHKWRDGGVGASDVPVIMGESPYMTPKQLFDKKCGFVSDEEPNEAMRWGIKNEPIARDWLCSHMGLRLEPACFEEGIYRASLDAYSESSGLLYEIKSPVSQATIDKVRESTAVPKHWVTQVEWQLIVSGTPRGFLAVWDAKAHCCYAVEVYVSQRRTRELKAAVDEFWQCVVSGISPQLTGDDYMEVDDDKLKELLVEFRYVRDHEQLLKKRKEILREKILEYGNDFNFKAHGYKVYRYKSPTIYDWKQMQLDGVDLQKYARPPAWHWRIMTPSKDRDVLPTLTGDNDE